MVSAVQPLTRATGICNSSSDGQSPAMRCWSSGFKQGVFGSARPQRYLSQWARPTCFHARRASLPTAALAIAAFHGLARALRAPMRAIHGKGLLATAELAEIRHVPVHANHGRKALRDLPCHGRRAKQSITSRLTSCTKTVRPEGRTRLAKPDWRQSQREASSK